MKKSFLFLLVLCIGMVSFSCTEDKDESEFTNSLAFGTSINYTNFTLNGEGTSFSTYPGNVAFRLESEEDFNGNPVKFVITKNGSAYSTEIFSDNPKPTGHIFITTLNYSTAGEYSVTGYIEKSTGDKVVATGTFQMY